MKVTSDNNIDNEVVDVLASWADLEGGFSKWVKEAFDEEYLTIKDEQGNPCNMIKWQREHAPGVIQTIKRGFDDRTYSHIEIIGGQNTGKTFFNALIVTYFVLTRPYCKAYVTSNSLAQLLGSAMENYKVVFSKLKKEIREQFEIKAFSIEILGSDGEKGDKAWGIYFITVDEDKPSKIRGKHNTPDHPYILFHHTEGSITSAEAMREIRNACFNNKGLVVMIEDSNRGPEPNNAYDLDFDRKLAKGEKYFYGTVVSQLDNEFRDDRLIQEIIDEYGIDSDVYRRQVTGERVKEGMHQVIPMRVLRRFEDAKYSEDELSSYHRVAGIDIAMTGEDNTVVVLRQGFLVLDVLEISEKSADKQIKQIIAYLRKKRCNLIGLEYATQYAQIFKDRFNKAGMTVEDYNAFQPKMDGRDYSTVEEKAGRKTFFNQRTQYWFLLKNWLDAGGCIPNIEKYKKLREEIVAPSFIYKDNEKILVENNKLIRPKLFPKRSPDRASALMSSFACRLIEDRGDGEIDFEMPMRGQLF